MEYLTIRKGNNLRTLMLLALLSLAVSVANAGTIGYCILAASVCTGNDTNANSVITASGNTPLGLTGLAAGDLGSISVLWVLNGDNGGYASVLTGNLTNVSNFVQGGGVLSFHDRYVTGAAGVLPGGGGISFTRDLGTDIDILNNGTLVTNGPGGAVSSTTLDGGNFSDHGYASLASLPGGAVGILSTADPTHVVDFYYGFGQGHVYYSSVPGDFYLTGGANANFKAIYLPNELAFQASLGSVPEPSTLVLLSCGLGALGLLRRKKHTAR